MPVTTPLTDSNRLRITLELSDFARRMRLQKLRRDHPTESEDEILDRLDTWMTTRPGAEYGDAEGRPIPWPRIRP